MQRPFLSLIFLCIRGLKDEGYLIWLLTGSATSVSNNI